MFRTTGAFAEFERSTHQRPRSCPRFDGRRKREQHHQALGRSRGGFSTKFHLKTHLNGDYLAFDFSGGEKGDAPQFPVLLDLGSDIEPRAIIGDKRYDSNANRPVLIVASIYEPATATISILSAVVLTAGIIGK
jgi:hypothetical protein